MCLLQIRHCAKCFFKLFLINLFLIGGWLLPNIVLVSVISLQYSCLENFKDRGAWQAIVHGVAKSQTWLGMYTHNTYNDKIPLLLWNCSWRQLITSPPIQCEELGLQNVWHPPPGYLSKGCHCFMLTHSFRTQKWDRICHLLCQCVITRVAMELGRLLPSPWHQGLVVLTSAQVKFAKLFVLFQCRALMKVKFYY